MKLSAEIDRRDQQLRIMRKQSESANNSILNLSKDKAVIETKLENNLNRLASEYQMTYEYALGHIEYEITGNERDEVLALRNDIASLGNINMSAPEEFNEVPGRCVMIKN